MIPFFFTMTFILDAVTRQADGGRCSGIEVDRNAYTWSLVLNVRNDNPA